MIYTFRNWLPIDMNPPPLSHVSSTKKWNMGIIAMNLWKSQQHLGPIASIRDTAQRRICNPITTPPAFCWPKNLSGPKHPDSSESVWAAALPPRSKRWSITIFNIVGTSDFVHGHPVYCEPLSLEHTEFLPSCSCRPWSCPTWGSYGCDAAAAWMRKAHVEQLGWNQLTTWRLFSKEHCRASLLRYGAVPQNTTSI